MMTIERALWRTAERFPDKVAVKAGKRQVTYAELIRKVSDAAHFFTTLPGYEAGRTVFLAAEKQLEALYAYFGAHLARLVVAPMAEDTNPTRLSYIGEVLCPMVTVGFADVGSVEALHLGWEAFASMPSAGHEELIFPEPSAVADVLFTTGTTGAPKGVPLTFANLMAAAEQINGYIGNTSEDVELLALPMSHSFGLGRVRCCLTNGQTLILMGSFANIKRLFRLLREENVTGFTMVPASWKYLQKFSGDALSEFSGQLRYIEMGSAYLGAEEKRHLAELFPTTRVTMHYGLTEASRSAFMEFHEDAQALSSVGKATPGVEIAIFDGQGERLPPNAEGEICVRGAHVTKGYLNVPNEETFYGEYFRTGDVGLMTPEGYLFLRSRLKELINVGGKKVAPQEVDAELFRIPGVQDCACVGVPDPEGVLGEVVKACIVRDPAVPVTFEQLSRELEGRLEHHKVPVVWEWIDAVPRTQNGKIQRGLLK